MNEVWLGVGLATLVGGALVMERKKPVFHQNQVQDIRYIRILPHAETKVTTEMVLRLVEQFAGYTRTKRERWKKGREWFRFLVHRDDKGIAFYLGFPQDRQTGVEKAITSIYPDSEQHVMDHDALPLPEPKNGYGGYFTLSQKGDREGLPLRTFDARRDEWGDVLTFLEPGTWIDLVFSTATPSELKQMIRKTQRTIRPGAAGGRYATWADIGREVIQEFNPRNAGQSQRKPPPPKITKVSDLDPDEQSQYKSLLQRFTGRESVFDVSLSVWSNHAHAGSVVQALATRFQGMMKHDNGIFLKRSRRSPIATIAPVPLPNQTMIWTASELGNIFHLPAGTHRIYQFIPHLEKGQRSLGKEEFSKGISVGKLNHPILGEREAKIPEDTFTKHFFIGGQSGGGKSSIIVEIKQSNLDNWIFDPDRAPGFTFFDPAQETALTIVNRLLEAERKGAKIPWEKVHYVKLANTEYPIGFNILHGSDSETALNLLEKVVPGVKAARMERLASNAISTLIDVGGHNMLGIMPLIQDEAFRRKILRQVKDPFLKKFWDTEFENFTGGSDGSVDALLTRLSPFTRNDDLRRMIGQSEWTIPIKKWMDEGHILLIDFLGVKKNIKSLAGEHLVNQYHFVAQTRQRGQRKLHFLEFDEAQSVQVPIMSEILAQDRKFGLCLGLITQFPEQFQPWLLNELENNITTIISCVQGSGSSAIMSKVMKRQFTPDQLEMLPERTAAISTKNEQNDVSSFMTKCDPPYVYLPDGRIARYKNEADEEEFLRYTMDKVLELQKRDWKHVSRVDKEIFAYLGIEEQEKIVVSQTETQQAPKNFKIRL